MYIYNIIQYIDIVYIYVVRKMGYHKCWCLYKAIIKFLPMFNVKCITIYKSICLHWWNGPTCV